MHRCLNGRAPLSPLLLRTCAARQTAGPITPARCPRVPVLGLGLATRAVSTRDALLGFSAVLAAVIVLVARRLLGTRRAGAPGASH
jgi:hypothetical protein